LLWNADERTPAVPSTKNNSRITRVLISPPNARGFYSIRDGNETKL
jgi:hypothetical protein